MNELARSDLTVQAERAVLVKLTLPDSVFDSANPLGELIRLTQTAGARVVDTVTQRRARIATTFYVGAGKAKEIRQRAEASDATVIIFDNDLSPSQIRELEAVIERKIIDRSELILDIFASRAKTYQARLQVELAQLEYTAPRLRGMWTHLERIAGAGGATGVGVVGGIGTRGPGERQIEIDRRLVAKRITLLKRRLAEIDRRKLREVRSRHNEYTVALVGYANVGKSTLLNALTGAGVKTEDRLFSTLDTKTSKWRLSGGRLALISDTVGFVRDLPHHLVASFRATLEEALHADLLLHVVDVSSSNAEMEMQAVNAVLHNMHFENQDRLVLLNKCDALSDPAELQVIEKKVPNCLRISSRTAFGLDDLHDYVLAKMSVLAQDLTIRTHPGNGKVLAYLDKHARILDRRYLADRLEIDIRISPAKLRQLQSRLDGVDQVTVCESDHP